jgi:hypothetical protein
VPKVWARFDVTGVLQSPTMQVLPPISEGGVMANLEQMRRAARPIRLEPRTAIHLFCGRCERTIVSNHIQRECHPCQLAGVKAFGSVIPRGEMSGY